MPYESVSNVLQGTDTARSNLLTNGGFEIWQRGNGPFTGNGTYSADRWQNTPVGTDTLSVSMNTANADTGSTRCAAVTFTLGTGAGVSNFVQLLPFTDSAQFGGRVASFSIRVRCSTVNAVKAGLYNGSVWTYSSNHTGGGAYETLTVNNVTLGAGQTIYVAVFFAASTTAYIDNAMLVVGSQPADYAPLHPADDLARCLRYYQRTAMGGVGLAAGGALPGLCISGTTAYVTQTLPVKMAIVPTASSSPAIDLGLAQSNGAVGALTALTAPGLFTDHVVWSCTVASGMVAGNATILSGQTGNGWLALEANP